MKLLYVVQRYGEEVLGGSESACRMFAENLVKRGHSVDVLTSCALDYVDWKNVLRPGESRLNGVRVIRLPVIEPRIEKYFSVSHGQLLASPRSAPLFDQQHWARLMGPNLDGLSDWLLRHSGDYEAVIFMTYLYATATVGLPTIAGRVPTILQPTAHDEPMAYFGLYHYLFRQPDAFLFFTEEEREIVNRIYQIDAAGPVVGIGMDLSMPAVDIPAFRAMYPDIANDYIVYVGRLDINKGVSELTNYFEEYVRRNGRKVDLVLAGDGPLDVVDHPNIHKTGFLSEEMKRSAIAGACALVQPSHYESFSIVLCEAWLQRRPALVQGGSEVLRGQALRSNGAIPYSNFPEFEASLDKLVEDPQLASLMGDAGHGYVTKMYDWVRVIDVFEDALEMAVRRFAERRLKTRQ